MDLLNASPPFHYLSLAHTTCQSPAKRLIRIQRELQLLSSPHLVSPHSSAIIIRLDEKVCDSLRFILTGPRDTPYAFGCFLFDLHLPLLYPSSPPLVWLKTTGDGTVRFLHQILDYFRHSYQHLYCSEFQI